MPAWIAVVTDRDEELARFPVECKPGWGWDVQRQLHGILSALQDAVDQEGRRTPGFDRDDVTDWGWWPPPNDPTYVAALGHTAVTKADDALAVLEQADDDDDSWKDAVREAMPHMRRFTNAVGELATEMVKPQPPPPRRTWRTLWLVRR